jgi:hypothetical protein
LLSIFAALHVEQYDNDVSSVTDTLNKPFGPQRRDTSAVRIRPQGATVQLTDSDPHPDEPGDNRKRHLKTHNHQHEASWLISTSTMWLHALFLYFIFAVSCTADVSINVQQLEDDAGASSKLIRSQLSNRLVWSAVAQQLTGQECTVSSSLTPAMCMYIWPNCIADHEVMSQI